MYMSDKVEAGQLRQLSIQFRLDEGWVEKGTPYLVVSEVQTEHYLPTWHCVLGGKSFYWSQKSISNDLVAQD